MSPGWKRRSRTSRLGLLVVGVVAALTTGVLSAAPAAGAEAEPPHVPVKYPVTGVSVVKKTNAELPLGPGFFNAKVYPIPGGGDIVGTLDLPPAHAKFKVFGLIPTEAQVTLEPTGPVTGKLQNGVVTTRAEAHIKLSKIWVGGILYIPVGNDCRTSTPVSIDVVSEPGFNLFQGGTLSGKYTIPPFQHCLLSDWLLSTLISGPDNTIKLNLGPVIPPGTT